MTVSLFEETELSQRGREELCAGAVILRGFALPDETAVFDALGHIRVQRHFGT